MKINNKINLGVSIKSVFVKLQIGGSQNFSL